MGLLPYFPLASGLLTGKYRKSEPPPKGSRLATWRSVSQRYVSEENWETVRRLEEFAGGRNRSLLELAVSWLLANPVVSSVIAGATKPQQVEQNVAAAGWTLSQEDLAQIDSLTGSGIS